MKNELTKAEISQIALLDQKELSDVIKPLSKEIHLFDSFVSGVLNIKDPVIFKELKEGQKLILQREDSKFDSNAINIYTENKIKIGYVPEKDNVVFARLMDAGKLLYGTVRHKELVAGYYKIVVKIFMRD